MCSIVDGLVVVLVVLEIVAKTVLVGSHFYFLFCFLSKRVNYSLIGATKTLQLRTNKNTRKL